MSLTKIKIGGQVLAAALAAATMVNCPQPTDEPTNPNNGKKTCTCPAGTVHEEGEECCEGGESCHCTTKPKPEEPDICKCDPGTTHPVGEKCCEDPKCGCEEEAPVIEVLMGHLGDTIPVYRHDDVEEGQADEAFSSVQAAFGTRGKSTQIQLKEKVKKVVITAEGINRRVREGDQVIGYFGLDLENGGENFMSGTVGYIDTPSNWVQIKSNSDIRLTAIPRQFITPKQLVGLEKRFNAVKQMAVANRWFMFQPQRMS